MANSIPTKATVNIASSKPTKFDLSCQHITTTDFGLLRPIYSRMLVPQDTFNFSVETLTRMDPMPSPSMVHVGLHTRAFFVPFRTVVKGFNEFVSNTKFINGQGNLVVPKIPRFPLYAFMELFLHPSFKDAFCTHVSSSAGYDYYIVIPGYDGKYVKLKPLGRQIMAIMHGLGYNFDFDNSSDSESIWYSALPLYAFCKVYLDWYVPSRYYNTDDGVLLMREVLYSDTSTNGNIGNPPFLSGNTLTTRGLYYLLVSGFNCYYTDDYFSNALYAPFGNQDPANEITVHHPNDFYDVASKGNIQAGAFSTESDNYWFTMQSIAAVQNMLNRNAIHDQKVLDYLKSEFGISPSEDSIQFSHYLGSSVDTLKVGDIMSTSDTMNEDGNGALLGQYGGRGASFNNSSFVCKAGPDFGMLLVLHDVNAKPFYYQGIHDEVTAIDRYDFFTPEYDNLQSEAIPKKRLYFDGDGDGIHTFSDPDDVFGFMPYYSDLKFAHDFLSGNFRLKSVNAGLDSWYLARKFKNDGSTSYIPEVGSSFSDSSVLSKYNNYSSIFYTDNSVADHFYQVHDIHVTAYRRMKSLVEQVLPDSEDEKNGKTTVDTMGTLKDRN